MATSFETVASEVLKDSISTAMFIDDKALEPFEENKEGFEDFTKLYKSFKNYNCHLDIRRFGNIGYKKKYNDSLSKIDLLILDWQLEESDSENKIPLKMLASAIYAKNVHFICIYTKRRDNEIEDQILYPITSYFSGIYKKKTDNVLCLLEDLLDLANMNLQGFQERFYGLFKELTFFYYQKKDLSEIKNKIESSLMELGINSEFKHLIDVNYCNSDFDQKLIHFGYEIFDAPSYGTQLTINISKNDPNSIYINNTVIIIRNKMNTPDLYENFRDSLIDRQNIFFTLFGLEMRSRFRASAGIIGAEIGSIDEIALFYHQKKLNNSLEFFELLKNIWKEQTSSLVYEKEIKILKVLEDYKSERKTNKELSNFRKTDSKNQQNLAKLNIFYNSLIDRELGDSVRFGDIFKIKWNKKYALCVTPHCDCIRPEKIDCMFHFIEGKERELSVGLKKSETKNLSFIYLDDKPICIEWTCKPFSIHIPPEKNYLNKLEKIVVKNNIKHLLYKCTLRENYCQRLANESFGYPLRVGITFAQT